MYNLNTFFFLFVFFVTVGAKYICCLFLMHRRSQTEVDKTGVVEGGEGNKDRSFLHSKSIHTSLESLRGTRLLAPTDQTLTCRFSTELCTVCHN